VRAGLFTEWKATGIVPVWRAANGTSADPVAIIADWRLNRIQPYSYNTGTVTYGTGNLIRIRLLKMRCRQGGLSTVAPQPHVPGIRAWNNNMANSMCVFGRPH